MKVTRLILIATGLLLSACAAPPKAPTMSAFDLDLSHPSPNSNYIRVAPGAGETGLPLPQHILSPDFSTYLRQQTGCVRDASRPTAVLGNRVMPAGYMVPITCP
ncbi:hypothetical protein [Roseovarius sp. 2305UL8-3]|uniref:hypothetical protein n=1 Tax=Roseovarius conchicola TaxID=3121636 RepID=UPI0035272E2A